MQMSASDARVNEGIVHLNLEETISKMYMCLVFLPKKTV